MERNYRHRQSAIVVALAAILLGGAVPVLGRITLGGDPPANPVDLDTSFARVAGLAPGFGGMFRDETGALNVYLAGAAQRAPVTRALASELGVRSRIDEIAFLRGRYDFGLLKSWHDRMGAVFNVPGVIMTDIDEGANRIRVGVSNRGARASVLRELSKLAVPSPAVTIEVAEPITQLATLRDRIRPIEGGVQIAFSNFLCTQGFNGVRLGVGGFATNSHCTDTQGRVESTQHYQPLVGSSNFIGTEIADPGYSRSNCPAGVRGKKCRWSDSSYSQRDSAVTADLGAIARTTSVNSGDLTIAGAFLIVSEGASLSGDVVNKVGRTTGWSQGPVTNTCVNVAVLGSNILQRCQDLVSANLASGDSGSPVFAIVAGDNVQLRGLLWGGNSSSFVYSPIANIERSDELGPISTCASGFIC